MKLIVLIVIALLVITLLILAFHKTGKKNGGGLKPVANPSGGSRAYNYDLVDAEDRRYTAPTQDVRQIEQTKAAVQNATQQAKAAIQINAAWFEQLKRNYEQAYILYMNGNISNARGRNYKYLKGLYYRSVDAGKRLHDAEKECQRAITALQRSGETHLIDSIKKCHSVVSKLKIEVWNNTRKLKLYIRDSSAEGRTWYNALEKRHAEQYGTGR